MSVYTPPTHLIFGAMKDIGNIFHRTKTHVTNISKHTVFLVTLFYRYNRNFINIHELHKLILNQREARKNNCYISFGYVAYHFLMLIFSLIGVSTTIMMVAEAFHITLGYNIGLEMLRSVK